MPLDDYTEAVERIREVAAYELEVPDGLESRLDAAAGGLLLEPGLLDEAASALVAGHLVLQGPPGTGKTSLALALAEAFGAETLLVTAHEDWSVYEVVGRQTLDVGDDGKEAIVPVDGYFTEAAISCAGAIGRWWDNPDDRPQATWLIIDELNRAHMDKAFGELFTALGTDDLIEVALPHRPSGQRLLAVPRRFRIIGTLNSIDNQFVNELSQGLRRRFTFLTADIPRRRRPEEPWDSTASDRSDAIRELEVVTQAATQRAAARLGASPTDFATYTTGAGRPSVVALFELAEQMRYAADPTITPYVPIGTAQLIDTLQIFLVHALRLKLTGGDVGAAMDWAVARRIVPLLEANISADVLNAFADGLGAPFDDATRLELRRIAAAGLYDVR
jgi:MoxR-like ATPase